MSSKSHPSYDVSVLAPALESLHEHVTRSKQRVEVTRPGTDERCVLISKQELVCLERALEILSDTEGVRDIASAIAAAAAAAEACDYAS